jgi:uncharacterized membrane protein YhaH (DUF805 family)
MPGAGDRGQRSKVRDYWVAWLFVVIILAVGIFAVGDLDYIDD